MRSFPAFSVCRTNTIKYVRGWSGVSPPHVTPTPPPPSLLWNEAVIADFAWLDLTEYRDSWMKTSPLNSEVSVRRQCVWMEPTSMASLGVKFIKRATKESPAGSSKTCATSLMDAASIVVSGVGSAGAGTVAAHPLKSRANRTNQTRGPTEPALQCG